MGIIDNLARRLGYSKATQQAQYPAWLADTAEVNGWAIPDGRLAGSQGALYQKLSWVQSAISLTARTVAGVKFNVLKRAGEDTEDVPNHPFEVLLSRPNPLQSRFELLEATAAYLTLTGNAYLWSNAPSETTPPAELWVIPSHQMTPVPDGKMFLRGYNYSPGAGKEDHFLPVWSVVHFKRFNPLSWFVGLSPIQAVNTVAQGDLAMQKWNANFFGKDNAKVPGALAFADPIIDSTWEQIRNDVRSNWGGTERSGPMMLRNVGKGGVEWLNMAMNQKDMEFLQGRTFTKEEIFALFAPGLASMLAVNATEANSVAGKATFMDMTVWPMLCLIAEKITNDLLPAYGPDLVGEFEDVRVTDRAMTLKEQEAYASVHTIDEVRAKFFDADPLGDVRGIMLPAQVGPATETPTKGTPFEEEEPETPMLEPGQPMQPEPTPEGEPPMAPEMIEAQRNPSPAVLAQREHMHQLAEAGMLAAPKAAMLTDLRRWRRKSMNRDGASVDFESDAIAPQLAEAIRLAQAEVGADVWAFIKAAPDSRAEVEKRLRQLIGDELNGQLASIVAAIMAGQKPDLSGLTAGLRAKLEPELAKIAYEIALREATTLGIMFDPARLNAAALAWAKSYVYDMVKGLTNTTLETVRNAIAQFVSTPGMTNADLEALLAPAFGEVRAEMIAVTEVTRAYSEATNSYQEMLRESGLNFVRVWQTSDDEKVCEICGPLDGKTEAVWADQFPSGPPAHVNCRCWTTLQYVRR